MMTCTHPPAARRLLEDGDEVCARCGRLFPRPMPTCRDCGERIVYIAERFAWRHRDGAADHGPRVAVR